MPPVYIFRFHIMMIPDIKQQTMFSKKEFFMEIERKYLISSVPCSFIISMPQDRTGISLHCTCGTYPPGQQWLHSDLQIQRNDDPGRIQSSADKRILWTLKEKSTDGSSRKRYVILLRILSLLSLIFFRRPCASDACEVEFPDEETANHFTPPKWFGEDVTFSSFYHNSTLSKLWYQLFVAFCSFATFCRIDIYL